MSHWPAFAIWLLALAAGVAAFDDYGISWDEDQQRRTGRVNARYILQQDDELATYVDRDYGPIFELALVPFELLEDDRDTILARHLASHLFFLLTAAAFYVLLFCHFRSRWLAGLGTVMLILTPRIYAHSFFNTKDVPALGFWVLSLLALKLASERPDPRRMAGLGAVVALLVNVRVVGLVFIGLALLLAAGAWWDRQTETRRAVIGVTAFAAAFALVLVATRPFLWPNPPTRLLEVVRNMSSFRWQGDVRFLGGYIRADSVPWNFLPTWILVSVPITYLILAATGMVSLVVRLLRGRVRLLRQPESRLAALVFLSFALPLLTAMVLTPVLYNDWRHFFFLYPSLLFFAVAGAAALFRSSPLQRPRLRRAAVVVMVILLARVAGWMLIAHPHQQVYLNAFRYTAGEPVWEWMEGDYWAVSYRQALEFILEQDPRDEIRVTGSYRPHVLIPKQKRMLPPEAGNRIVPARREEPADYLITNWRAIPTAASFCPPGPLLKEITAGGLPVAAVYSVDDPQSLMRPDALVAPGAAPHRPD